MKETAQEWEQMHARPLSHADRNELRDALREARRSICFGCEMDEEAREHLDAVGVDYSNLVPNGDGDAPDRFEPDEPLDWRWKAVPAGTDEARRYSEIRDRPKVGDRVRRLWSEHVGTVRGHRRHGRRGFAVSVAWDIGDPDEPIDHAMSQLVPVEFIGAAPLERPNAKERAIESIRSLDIEKPDPPECDADALEQQAISDGRKTERSEDGGVLVFSEGGHRYYDREGHLIAASTQTWEARRAAVGD